MSIIEDIKKAKRDAEIELEMTLLGLILDFENRIGASITDMKLELIRHQIVGKLDAKLVALHCKLVVEI